jgi:3-hydroxyacyl-[acyl-carrier-protein] dehydratase
MRYVLLDRLRVLVPGREVVAERTFPAGDDYLADHFPGLPLVPGALLIEAMAQAAGWALLTAPPALPPTEPTAAGAAAAPETPGERPGGGRVELASLVHFPFLVLVGAAKFRRPVSPGEPLTLHASVERRDERAAEAVVRVVAAGEVVANARLTFALRELPDAVRPPLASWVAATHAALTAQG